MTRLKPLGLDMAEALARCPPDTAEERDALIHLFTAIEAGAIAGAVTGRPEPAKED